MQQTLIINDCHLGTKRQAGTTAKSREELDIWIFDQFKKLLSIPHDTVVILGDLFDTRNVSETVMLKVIQELKSHRCSLVLGNHDRSGNFGSEISSAEFVAALAGCELIKEPKYWGNENVYIVPSLFSQQEFDEAISKCPEGATLLTHCNIDSPFASGDHSLNLSLEQIKGLGKVITGHEHHQREYHNVTVIGNQFPSSIADCQGPKKRAMYLDGTEVETWDGSNYQKYLYTDDFESSSAQFIEIIGLCQPGEITEITKRILKFRAKSDAFIIKNGVKVQQKNETVAIEAVTHFNIIGLFLEALPESTRAKVSKCI